MNNTLVGYYDPFRDQLLSLSSLSILDRMDDDMKKHADRIREEWKPVYMIEEVNE